MDKNALIKPLLEGPEKLARLLEENRSRLGKSYGPGKWTIQQIVSHLADCETIFVTRFLKCIGEEGQPQTPFDENRWAAELKYTERPVELSLQMLQSARAVLAWYVENLPVETLARTSLHPHYGPQTAGRIAARAVIHFEHHFGQIEAAAAGKGWAKDPELEKKLALPY